ncbi:glycoside hydrolase family 32 protein [Paenibacillus amylolyticus]|uniref:glycoside hydrolase family 32 protein n=1 Tax=Paenibacillus amylolyticus TaxID=1451 RepID=UPI00201D8D0A|nr:glycoside hydrolase family 32 protein [Paenibacillus amylolyticus]MCL6663291.1 glycoside hydrolase family 32 protein [Paenibacillus amylolyticus]
MNQERYEKQEIDTRQETDLGLTSSSAQTKESYTLARANAYIKEHRHQVDPTYRMAYHLMPEVGWMNDPNGFIYFGGMYHMFYQHYPYEPVWGPMHWGHAVSRDLVTWSYLPIALAPDQSYDSGGCFSGSAIVQDGKLVLMYTGHVVTGPDKDNDYLQTQNIAVSDNGIDFVKSAMNPVIRLDQIPAHTSPKDFRDPKVFERNGVYYCVLGSNDAAGKGVILLYRSTDLLDWSYVNIMAQSDGTLGDNWECPDLFTLDGRDVLIMSPQRMPAQGDNYRNLHSTVYMMGTLDEDQGVLKYEQYVPLDCGFDFYAPQTMEDAQGRRIMVAWMDTWETEIPTQQSHAWAGAMTLPRQLIRRGERLIFQPLPELTEYRSEGTEQYGIHLNGDEHDFDLGISGDRYELYAVFEAEQARHFGLKLRTGEDEETVISYDVEQRRLCLNRKQAGQGPGGERAATVELLDGKLELHIFMDVSSVEVFIQQGEQVMTGRIYPGPNSTGIKAFSSGTCTLTELCKWDIRIPR